MGEVPLPSVYVRRQHLDLRDAVPTPKDESKTDKASAVPRTIIIIIIISI